MKVKEFVLFKKNELLQFCIYRLIFGISYSFMIPVIPLFFSSIGIATTMVGVVMSLYGVSKALAQIPFGVVSDKIGDKLLLIIAVGLMAFIPIGYVFFNSQLLVSGVYVLQGAILGMAAPATFSILSRSLEESKRGECTGFASAVFTLGGGIGAAIAGFIISKFGNYNIVFYITSIGIFLTFLFVILKIKKSDISTTEKKNHNKKGLKLIIKDIKKYKLGYKILLLSFIAMLGDFIYGCVVSIFPFYGSEVLGASVGYVSTIISLYLFIFGFGAPIAGWVSDKIGNKKQLYISFIVMNGTLFALYLIRNKVLFASIIIIYFLGATFLNASLQSLLSEFGENENIKGIVFGVVGASESLGYALGPIVSAYIYSLNKTWLFLGLLIVSILVLGVYHFLHKKAYIN
ncbi:MFS transporter [Clostridium chauvoei]|uniref:Putative Transporter, major facilitator family n=1 Tax=Clostridium chauvoei JF4335 TaxID=1351755 RepID=A0A1U6JQK8_9CLOT|nr:MFS transporter [Clostridium chauvoei]ATD58435.1 MFS transporter [Clostridium chauvoei]MBX7284126.1 MFS transporter [Clostridium chauvoei]MBX7286654.1 MFS transporter [Clostridium chauvoei]MBX7289181.1 MFS transporter [Clostridium chauvoei]MBX7294123.1 MFS transporter [Clostridium chauvoei]